MDQRWPEDFTVGVLKLPSHPQLADHEYCALLLYSNVINYTKLCIFFDFPIVRTRRSASVEESQWKELEEKWWNPITVF